ITPIAVRQAPASTTFLPILTSNELYVFLFVKKLTIKYYHILLDNSIGRMMRGDGAFVAK
ncbi:MAG: hypothetical protein K5894_13565, partial [Lachnospiraceae bacterium]|nr:hypothetical protein [Lachnospiraceae bacterium]